MEGFTEIVLQVEDIVLVERDEEGVDFGIGEDGEWHLGQDQFLESENEKGISETLSISAKIWARNIYKI